MPAAAASARLKAAAAAKIWGIGVDKDQYSDAKRVMTSGVKRVDNGVYQAIQKAKNGGFKRGGNLLFNLKNGGMSVGKINPAVPKAYIKLMNHVQDEDHQQEAQGPDEALDGSSYAVCDGRACGPARFFGRTPSMGVVRGLVALAVLGAAAALMAAAAAGASGGNGTSATTTGNSAGSNTTVALVTDIGDFNDRSFNHSQK